MPDVQTVRMRRAPISRTTSVIAALATLAASSLAVWGPEIVQATSSTVTDTTELRAAITTFNSSADGAADTITLANAGPFVLPCGTNEEANADGDLDYTAADDLTITYAGPGRATIAVDQTGGGCFQERVIDHRGSGTMRIEHVVIADGNLRDGGGSGLGDGGGVRVTATDARLELHDVVVENNRSSDGDTISLGSPGGGIYANNATIVVTDSIIRDNQAGSGRDATASSAGTGGRGGGLAINNGAIELMNTVVEANHAGDGGDGNATEFAGIGGTGGGIIILNTGDLTISGGRIGGLTADRGNHAGDAGSAGDGGGRGGGLGGGVVGSFAGTTTLTGTEVAYNGAGAGSSNDINSNGRGGSGGGVYSTGIVIIDTSEIHHNTAGPGAAAVTLTGMTGGDGGGLYVFGSGADLTIIDSTISDNSAGAGGASQTGAGGTGGFGGGVVYGGAAVTITRSDVVGNSAGPGGDSASDFGGTGGSGGGLSIGSFTTTSPAAVIDDSTIADNTAGPGGSGSLADGNPGNGGGIRSGAGTLSTDGSLLANNGGARFGGGIYAQANETITNSTFHANIATSHGGGIYGTAGSRVLNAVTFTENGNGAGGSIFEALPGDKVTVSRTVFATPASTSNCGGAGDVVDAGDNLEHHPTGVGTCGLGTPTVTTIDIGPLQDNGGPTETRLPGATSDLVDAIAQGDCVETVDQRGIGRPSGAGCDIGAVELDLFITAVADDGMGLASELTVDILANDLTGDVALDPASVTVTNGPSDGTTEVDTSTGEVTYTPIGSFSGIDQFTYSVCLVGFPLVCGAAVVDIDIEQPDAVPDAFTFVDVTGVATATEQTSDAITVAGTNQPAAISATGGEYSVNGGGFTSAAGTVDSGDTVRARHTSAGTHDTTTDTTVTIGGVSDTFTSTTAAATAPAGATRYVPLTPTRLFDTRDGTGLAAAGKLAGGDTLDVEVAGQAGVPDGAVAVVINLTVAAPEAPGFVTAFPRGGTIPNASTLNVTGPGQVRPNLATVPLDGDGYMSAFALMTTHLLGDVAGYYVETTEAVAGGRLVPLPPTRLFDTRPNASNGPKGFVPADGSISVQVAGQAGVPNSGVSAVVLNVTATQSAGPNFITVWPTGQPLPKASSLNLGTGETTANLVIVPVGDGGQIDFYSLAGAHLLADVTGYLTDDTAAVETMGLFVPLTPARVFDTRESQPANGPKGFVGAGQTITTQTTGVVGIPIDAAAVVLNVTATAAATGFITAWPTGDALPNASTLNPQGPNDTRPNAAILPVGAGGQIDYFALNGAHLLADTTGYFLS